MTVESYEQRILIPADGMWLCNRNAKIISDKVYLGINADAKEWEEITAEEKEKLEAEWEAEAEMVQ